MHHFNPIASFGRTAVVATSLMSMASAHLFIAEPKPIQGSAPKDPLDPSGSNFPCHGAALPTSGGQKIAAGETFPLKFEMAEGANTAVHGGGSCQLAILSDTSNAADPSSWNVIYSIEGGCPSNTKLNLPPGYEACTSPGQSDCMNSWDIPMPKDVKSGNAILSWTWFNTVGNREMYQNCVNVDITGGSGEGTFPPLFVANLASVNSVATTEGTDVLFPDPGEFVTTMSATDGWNYPKATIASGDSGKGPSGYTAPKETSAPAYSAPASSAPAYSAPASSAPANSAPTQIASQIQSYDNQKQKQTYTTLATATSSAAAAPSTTAPSSEAPAPTGYSSGSNVGSNTTSSGDTTECSEDGALVCIGDDSFGICDHGSAVKRPLAKGTACTNGVISGINRFRRHVHGNAHKH